VRKWRIINGAWPNNTTAGLCIKDNMLVFVPGALDRFYPTPLGKLSPNGGRNAIASRGALQAAFPLSLARYPVIRGAILE
jgi:hypothetical protein